AASCHAGPTAPWTPPGAADRRERPRGGDRRMVGGRAYALGVDPTLLAWTAAGVAVLALLLAAVAWRRLRVVDRRLARMIEAGAPTSTAQERIDELSDDLARVRADLTQALRHVAVVRYDAFGDMGGRMSFSAA